MRRMPRIPVPSRQQGATLVIALLVLVLIMMIGVTAVSTSNTQFSLAGNLQFEDGAMNNAETAVAAAEKWLATSTATTPPVPHYSDVGFTTYNASGKPELLPLAASVNPLTMTWSDSNSVSVNGNSAQRYFIQLMSSDNLLQGSSQVLGRQGISVCNKVNTYQITGRGTSARGATKIVQSFYSVLSCPPL